ncbi:MAG: GAF domain-containing protein [Aggregatilineales bacterium]
MMERLLNLIDVSEYRTRTEQDTARFVYATLALMFISWFLFAFIVRQWNIPGITTDALLIETLPYRADTALYFFLPIGIFIITVMLLRQGRLALATWGPAAMFYTFALLPPLLNNTFDIPANSVSLALFLILAILLNRQIGLYLGLPVILGTLALSPGNIVEEGMLLVMLFQFSSAAIIALLFARYAPVNREVQEAAATLERLKLAEITSLITREASRRAPLSDILDLVLSLILEKYPQVYHAQIFLVDDSHVNANLYASTGSIGEKLLANGHQLAVGGLSVIGQVTSQGQVVVQTAMDKDSIHYKNQLLPDTQVEAAFPLFAGDKIIGALDLQSQWTDAFPDDDLPGFQSMADSLSLVLDNVQQFELAQQRIAENQDGIIEARDALRDIERLNQRLIGQAWSEYLRREDRSIGLRFDSNEETLETDLEWSAEMANALRDNQPVQDGQTLAYPLRLQGQVIGAIEFEMDENRMIEPEDLALLEEISEQFGLAAENTRLVEVSQKAARREAIINEISSRIQGSTNVEATLTEATRGLYETINANRVSIQLAKPVQKTTAQNGTHQRSDTTTLQG